MGKMAGKLYKHYRFGLVRVLIQPNYKAGGPRNVAIRILETGTKSIVPQRSLRNVFKSKSLERKIPVTEVGPQLDTADGKNCSSKGPAKCPEIAKSIKGKNE